MSHEAPGLPGFGWVDYTVHHQWWMDYLMRLPTIIMGCFALAMACAYFIKTFRLEFNLEPAEVIAFFVLGYIGIFQEIEQWGGDMVWWRLPGLMVGVPATVVAIYRRPWSQRVVRSSTKDDAG